MAGTLRGQPGPRMIHENLAHGAGGRGEENLFVLETGPVAKLQEGFVDESRGLQALVAPLCTEAPRRNGAEFAIEEGQEILGAHPLGDGGLRRSNARARHTLDSMAKVG